MSMNKYLRLIVLVTIFAFGCFSIVLAAREKGLSHGDKKFVKEAASAGMMEVQAGELAQNKAQSADVKAFGSRMVTDHGKVNDELKKIAQQKNVPVADKLERKHKSMVDKLGKASGAEFDKKYMEMMVKDHVADVKEFRKASEKLTDPDLKSWAGTTLPTLEDHLKQAKEIAQKLGVDVKKYDKEDMGGDKKHKM